MSERRVTFYTRPGCSLCEKAIFVVNKVMAEIPFHLEVLDITQDPELLRKYEWNIPVVCIDGVEVCRYHVNEEQFRFRLVNAVE